MKLGKLANLEKVELNEEIEGLKEEIKHFNAVLENPLGELRNRLKAITDKYAPSVKAYILVPIVVSMFADFLNSLIITLFINIIK